MYLATVVCDLAGLRVQPDSADTSVRFLRITDYVHLSGVLGQKHRHLRNPVVGRNGRDAPKESRTSSQMEPVNMRTKFLAATQLRERVRETPNQVVGNIQVTSALVGQGKLLLNHFFVSLRKSSLCFDA
jgi:hypothetical protein